MKKIAGQLKLKMEENTRKVQEVNGIKQENKDLSSFAEKVRNENDRLAADNDRLKVILCSSICFRDFMTSLVQRIRKFGTKIRN